MRARIVAIGNSRGVRIPRALLQQAGLDEEIELHAEPGRIVIESARRPRAGWDVAATAMRQADEDLLLDGDTPTTFDTQEWDWNARGRSAAD